MGKLNRWVYAVVGVVVLLFAGLVYTWSTMAKTIAANTGWDAAQLSTTFTLVMSFFCIGCLVAGIFAKKVSPKIYVILSGILFLIGFLIAGCAGDRLGMLYLGFGTFCGLGAGFAYNAAMSTMSSWFPDKQGLISGILLMGFGISAFIVGKIFAAVAPADGSDTWMSIFQILGILIFAVMIVCSFFFIKPEIGYHPEKGEIKKKVVREPASDVPATQMMKNLSFWMYYVWAILLSAAGLVLVSQANGIATQVAIEQGGISDGTIATVVGFISVFNGIGRIFFGGLFDRYGYRKTMIFDMVIFLVAAAMLIVAIISNTYSLIAIGFAVGGFAYGGVTPTNSAIISDFYGRTHYPINFSIINTNLLIASFASTIAGKLQVATGSYLSTILLMLVVTMVGFVVFFFIRRPDVDF